VENKLVCVTEKGIFRTTPKILKMGFGREKRRGGKRKWKVQATVLKPYIDDE